LTDPLWTVHKREQFDKMIAAAGTLGAAHYQIPLRASREGRINLAIASRGGDISIGQLKRSPRPILVVIGDDDYASTGPVGWPIARKLFRWARHVVIHATGADDTSYRLAVEMAVTVRRLVLVETSSDCAGAWAAACRQAHIPALALMPANGQHPLPLSREQVQ
jgi:hypothetical protein